MNKPLFALALAIVLYSCVQERPAPQEEAEPEVKSEKLAFDPHFSHTVFIWLKNPESAEDRQAFETALETFLENSEYAQTNFVGTPPKAIREVVDDSFTYQLTVTFASAEDQAAYQDEPAHLKFVEQAKELWEKVVVYDATPYKAID
jgi:PBP1b-binding outer membrane lipoprotein LpoB